MKSNFVYKMVHPCCEYPLQNCVSYLALYDIVWSFLRTIYHMNELLTTFDSWVAAGRIPDYGPISSSFDGFFVVIYVTYFGLAICMIVGAHTQDPKKLLIWVILTSLVIVVQLVVFQISLLVGHYSSFKLETPPETFYEELDPDFLVLKLPTQSVCVLGTFYTMYEIWVVKLFIEELEDDSLYRDTSDDRLAGHPLSTLNHLHHHHHGLHHHRRSHPFNRNP